MVLNVIWEVNFNECLNEWLEAVSTCLDLNRMGMNTSLGLCLFKEVSNVQSTNEQKWHREWIKTWTNENGLEDELGKMVDFSQQLTKINCRLETKVFLCRMDLCI